MQQLRRVHRAAAEDHLAPGAHECGVARLAAARVAHTDRALAVEQHGGGLSARADVQIGAALGWAQESTRGALPPSLVDRALIVADAELGGTVVVAVARNAVADRASDERLADRMEPVHVGHGLRAGTAVEGILAGA